MTKLYRLLTMISVITALGAFGWKIVRETKCANHWPKSPQPELGRIIPHNARRSITVYISRQDDRRDLMIQIVFLISGITTFAFSGLSGDLKNYLSPGSSSIK
jgi:hypothetical protein